MVHKVMRVVDDGKYGFSVNFADADQAMKPFDPRVDILNGKARIQGFGNVYTVQDAREAAQVVLELARLGEQMENEAKSLVHDAASPEDIPKAVREYVAKYGDDPDVF